MSSNIDIPRPPCMYIGSIPPFQLCFGPAVIRLAPHTSCNRRHLISGSFKVIYGPAYWCKWPGIQPHHLNIDSIDSSERTPEIRTALRRKPRMLINSCVSQAAMVRVIKTQGFVKFTKSLVMTTNFICSLKQKVCRGKNLLLRKICIAIANWLSTI